MACCQAEHDGICNKDYVYSIKEELWKALEGEEAGNCEICNVDIIKDGGCPNMICGFCQNHFRWEPFMLPPPYVNKPHKILVRQIHNYGVTGEYEETKMGT